MHVRSLSRGLTGLLGPSWLVPTLFVPLLTLSACHSASPPVQTVAPPHASPAKPLRTAARATRPKKADAPCLTADRKQALFRQFAALQEGDAIDTATDARPAPLPSPVSPASCNMAEK